MVKLGPGQKTLAGHMAPRRIEASAVRRVVHQVVRAVARGADFDAIMRISLLNAGLEDVPTAPGTLSAYVLGSLRDTVATFADANAAAGLVKGLRPLLQTKTEELGDDAPEVRAAEEEAPAPSAGAMVLLVDDDVEVRAALVRVLRKSGYNAVSAPEPNVALAMCVRRRPDIVIAAKDMQGTTGRQLGALLHVAFGNDAPPLVLLTTDDASKEDRAAAAAVVSKPVDETSLVEALAAIRPPK
jgi:CheY-like chemotaxis protein